jgi:cation-transporting P-type ATPase F
MIFAQLLFTHTPLMNQLFHTAPLSTEGWLRIVSVGLIAFLVVGFEKWIRRKAEPNETQKNP